MEFSFTPALPPGGDDAQELILDIIAANGGVFEGQTRLYKAFYFANLFHLADEGTRLIDFPLVGMPNGPGIEAGNLLLRSLCEEGRLEHVDRLNGPYSEAVYKICEARAHLPPNSSRAKAIRETLDFVRDKSARELSDLTHEHSHSWRSTRSGKELPIELDLLEAGQYEDLARRVVKNKSALSGLFSSPS